MSIQIDYQFTYNGVGICKLNIPFVLIGVKMKIFFLSAVIKAGCFWPGVNLSWYGIVAYVLPNASNPLKTNPRMVDTFNFKHGICSLIDFLKSLHVSWFKEFTYGFLSKCCLAKVFGRRKRFSATFKKVTATQNQFGLVIVA